MTQEKLAQAIERTLDGAIRRRSGNYADLPGALEYIGQIIDAIKTTRQTADEAFRGTLDIVDDYYGRLWANVDTALYDQQRRLLEQLENEEPCLIW